MYSTDKTTTNKFPVVYRNHYEGTAFSFLRAHISYGVPSQRDSLLLTYPNMYKTTKTLSLLVYSKRLKFSSAVFALVPDFICSWQVVSIVFENRKQNIYDLLQADVEDLPASFTLARIYNNM